jgi:adenylate cyclase
MSAIPRKYQAKIMAWSLVASLGLLALFGFFSKPIDEIDTSIQGYLTRYRLTHQAPAVVEGIRDGPGKQIVLVTIDEQSLRNLKLSWPFPRELHAEIIRRLDLLGAKSIALDILFSEPSEDEEEDVALIEALKNPKVILTHRLDVRSDKLEPIHPHAPFTQSWSEKELERRLGFTADWDRHFVALRVHQKGAPRYYSLATALLAHFRGVHPAELLDGLLLNTRFMKLRNVTLLTRGGLLNFLALDLPEYTSETPTTLTLGDFVQILTLEDLLTLDEELLAPGLLDSEEFMALVGVTAPGGFDEKDLPVGKIAGLVVHVNILLNLMNDDFVLGPPTWLIGIVLLFLGATIGFAGARLSQGKFVALCLGLLLLVWSGSLICSVGILGRVLWTPFTEPTITVVLVTALVAVLRQQSDRRELNKVLAIMEEVCPAADMQKVLAEGELTPGGERRELTILFSDLRDYTTFVEREGASMDLLSFMNRYFDSVSHILERHGGVVLDYQGDAQMVAFGLKEESKPNHAAAAVKAAVEIILTFDFMRKTEKAKGLDMPDTGVGVCSGEVSFGVLGGERRKQFAAIGDAANVAARLQGKSVELGARVLLARSTRVLAGEAVVTDYIDDISLKGKQKKVGVWSADIEEMVKREMVQIKDA